MENLLEIVFTSGIISVIISYLMFQKGNQLKHITEERKKWREKLREIASNLLNADRKETLKLLTELKVRINTYGYGKKWDEDILHDSHIWNLIIEIENLPEEEFCNYSSKLIKCKNCIIDYISLLLKDDWERSKAEVYGIKKNEFCFFLVNILEIIAISVLAVTFDKSIALYYKVNIVSLIIWVIIVLLLLSFFIKMIVDVKKCCSNVEQRELEKKDIIKKREENYKNALKKIRAKYESK